MVWPVLVAFDDPLARETVTMACRHADVVVVGTGAHGSWAERECAVRAPVTVVCGTDLADGPAEDFIETWRRRGADVVVVSDDLSPDRFIRLLELGVAGHLRFSASLGQLAEAIAAVTRGGAALDPIDAATLLDQWRRLRAAPGLRRGSRPPGSLTTRELDVLESMVEGLTTKGIARRLGLANKTIENHKVRIFDKLGVRNQAEAVAFTIAEGLLTSRLRVVLGSAPS